MYLVVWSYMSNHLMIPNGAHYLNNNSLSFDRRKEALERVEALLKDRLVFDVQLYKRERLPSTKNLYGPLTTE